MEIFKDNTEFGFSSYQKEARKTAIYHEKGGHSYPYLGLAGEVGEVCEKRKKFMRDSSDLSEFKDALTKELGDVLWYVANIAADMEISLEEIAKRNLSKLADRQKRNTLQGSGDDR